MHHIFVSLSIVRWRVRLGLRQVSAGARWILHHFWREINRLVRFDFSFSGNQSRVSAQPKGRPKIFKRRQKPFLMINRNFYPIPRRSFSFYIGRGQDHHVRNRIDLK